MRTSKRRSIRNNVREQLVKDGTTESPYGHQVDRWIKASALRCPQCQGSLTASEPQDEGEAINVDWACPEHGMQYTTSTRR